MNLLEHGNAIKELREKGVGYGKIAKQIGSVKSSVKSYCNKNGLSSKDLGRWVTDFSENGICKSCGKEYQKTSPDQKYCCDECKPWTYKQKLLGFTCVVCGKVCAGHGKRKTCSTECEKVWVKGRNKGKSPSKACLWCGEEFKSPNNRQVCCSRECGHKYAGAKRSKAIEKQKAEGLKEKVCSVCGKKYLGNNKYCSRECGYEAMRKKETYVCKHCGKTYIPKAADRVTFCSRECSVAYMKKFPHGKMYANKKDAKKAYHEKVKARLQPIREARAIERERKAQIRREEKSKQREVERIARLTSVCQECGVTFVGSCAGMKYCGKECRSRAGNRMKDIKRRARLKENGKIEWDISIERLIKRDKNICHICGGKCNTNDKYVDDKGTVICGDDYPSIDHVKPVASGGTHTWGNVKLAHRGCNTVKGARKYYERSDGQVILAM